jgi:hypothetical protein
MWLCEKTPALLGREHADTVEQLVNKLHEFHALPLSIRPTDRPNSLESGAEVVMQRTDISDEYRKALESKDK